MAHPNEELLRKGYKAFSESDLETIGTLFADDVVWHNPGKSSIAGDYKGKEQVFELFGKVTQETGGTFKTEVHDVIANDEHAVVLVTTSAEKGGKSYEGNGVGVYHVKDGKVTEAWQLAEDQYAIDEFWG
ncbi:MAG: nuclear transport factor 2 family protein [Actinobacteria bacterium]|nr:nuclear transport factor 2 family protein [Actinomycetota bacterium]